MIWFDDNINQDKQKVINCGNTKRKQNKRY